MINVDKIITISLQENHTRRISTQNELAKLGLKTDFFLAMRDLEQPERGCFQSHQAVCQEALSAQHKTVLVFEDDVKILPFHTKQIDRMNHFIAHQAKDFDILYLGLIIGKMWYVGKQSIVRATGAGAHAYILSTQGMEKLATYQYNGTPIDKIMKHDFKCYSIYPIIAEQYPETSIPSDISSVRQGEEVKNDIFWKNNYQKQRWILLRYWHKFFSRH